MSQNIVPQNLNEEFVQEQVAHEVVQELVVQEEEEVMNPEIDCPVCYMHMEARDVGDNCNHALCGMCFTRIRETTNKCPICREQLMNPQPENIIQNILQDIIQYNVEQYDNQYIHELMINTFNYDEVIPGEREIIFEGEDVEPTTQLFNGRRWFDVTTQQIRIYQDGLFLLDAEYRQINEHYTSERNIAIRQLAMNYDDFNTHQNCPFCGIQRTIEANRYIIHRFIRYHGNDDEFRTNMNVGITNVNYCWGTNTFDGQGLNCCLLCWISFRNLMHIIY
jgi:hypothetical protein